MPTLADLDAAMLRPGRAVPAVGRLGGGAIAMTEPDRPWRVVGASAAVYQLRQPSGRVLALRCPLTDRDRLDPALSDRYRALVADRALAPLRGAAGPLLGDVSFLADGLALPSPDGRPVPHPLIALEWVAGPTLAAAADRACRADDRAYLTALGDAWAATMTSLAGVGFDHGDPTPDNALLRPGGGLALVDYDACAWPGAPSPPPARPPAAYAHPSGKTAPVGRRDAFPALVVYASLRALARRPSLRGRQGDPRPQPGGALLFAAADLRDPDASTLFDELERVDDPTLRWLLALLREACVEPVSAVPSLPDVVSALRRAPRDVDPPRRAPRERPAAPPPPPRTPPHAPSPAAASPVARERQRRLTELNALLLSGDEGAAERYWNESGLAGDAVAVREVGPRMAELARGRLARGAPAAAERGDTAAPLRDWDVGRFGDALPAAAPRPAVDAARRRARTVERVRAALDAGDRETVVRLWSEVRDDSLASLLSIRAHAVFAEEARAVVAAALARGDDDALVAAVGEAEALGVPVEPAARRAARAARVRAETRRALAAAVAADDRPTLASLALSGRLDDLGRLAPATVRATLRALAWPLLERALESRDDAAILTAYDPELFDEEGALPLEQRALVELARKRTAWLAAVRAGIRQRDTSALRVALAKAPPGAERRLSAVERRRIARITARGDAVERLAIALREGPDAAVLEALTGVEASGATVPEALDWAAVRGVVDRATLAEAIRAAASADPPDYALLARLLPAARAAAATGGAEGGELARLEADVLRTAHLTRLREALEVGDDAAIAAAARPDPYGALSRLSDGERTRVWRALGLPLGASPG